MRRREFLTLLSGAAVAWPLAARAQQPERLRRIGVLMTGGENDPLSKTRVVAFEQALQAAGWIAGRNVRLDYRWDRGDAEETRALAKELIGLQPEVLVGAGAPAVPALLQETRTTPVVFLQVSDPVGSGFVSNLARPGANATGFTNYEFSMGGKWLELLKQIVPGITRVLIMFHPQAVTWTGHLQTINAGAPAFAVQATQANVDSAATVENAINTFAREPAGGMIVLPSTFMTVHRERIVALAAQHRLPTVYPLRFFVTSGGLMSYGSDPVEAYRQAADYVDRILKGKKPGNLPVQAPTKYELVINLKTAKALGIEVPPTLIARADEVIE